MLSSPNRVPQADLSAKIFGAMESRRNRPIDAQTPSGIARVRIDCVDCYCRNEACSQPPTVGEHNSVPLDNRDPLSVFSKLVRSRQSPSFACTWTLKDSGHSCKDRSEATTPRRQPTQNTFLSRSYATITLQVRLLPSFALVKVLDTCTPPSLQRVKSAPAVGFG